MDIELFDTDPFKEVEGVWRPFGADAEVLIARWENPNHERLMRKKLRAEKEVIQAQDELSDAAVERITIEVMSHTILLGWKGFKTKGANPGEKVDFPYSQQNALALLKKKDFREKIKSMSDVIDHYQTKTEEEGVNA